MKRFLAAIGYSRSLDIKERFTYIIGAVSVGLLAMFFVFYLIFVKSLILYLVTSINLIAFCSIFIFLWKKKYYTAKFLLLAGFFLQEFSIVFLWFPKDANFNFFLFIVTPITFFIYDFTKDKDKIILIMANVLAIVMLILSESLPLNTPLIPLKTGIVHLFSVFSILSTVLSIFIVYFFYADTLHAINRELHFLANTDSLTKIFNRRTLFKEGKEVFRIHLKYGVHFTFLLLDIDHFKRINDTYGHPAGDAVLMQISELIKAKIRKNDIFSRYGGEEFAIIFKDTSLDANITAAHNIKDAVEQHQFVLSDGTKLNVTISVGVSYNKEDYSSFDEIVLAADKALYQAKERGRNKVVVCE